MSKESGRSVVFWTKAGMDCAPIWVQLGADKHVQLADPRWRNRGAFAAYRTEQSFRRGARSFRSHSAPRNTHEIPRQRRRRAQLDCGFDAASDPITARLLATSRGQCFEHLRRARERGFHVRVTVWKQENGLVSAAKRGLVLGWGRRQRAWSADTRRVDKADDRAVTTGVAAFNTQ